MATFALPSTLARGTFVTSTMYSALGSWRRPPNAKVRRAASQSITTLTWTAVQFDTEDWDTNNLWSSTANNKVKFATAGKYQVNGSAGFAASTSGTIRFIGIGKNSTNDPNQFQGGHSNFTNQFPAAARPVMSCSGLVSLTTADTICMLVIHDRGSALTTSTAGGEKPHCSILWVST